MNTHACTRTHTHKYTHIYIHTHVYTILHKLDILQVGDGTNFVLVFSGALLEQAESLLKMGLSPSDVIEGYEMALTKALEILPCNVYVHTISI